MVSLKCELEGGRSVRKRAESVTLTRRHVAYQAFKSGSKRGTWQKAEIADDGAKAEYVNSYWRRHRAAYFSLHSILYWYVRPCRIWHGDNRQANNYRKSENGRTNSSDCVIAVPIQLATATVNGHECCDREIPDAVAYVSMIYD